MQCFAPITLLKGKVLEKYPEGLTVPCGKCLGCRLKRRQEWAIRCIHELHTTEKACFVTLTYDDEHLPKNNEVSKDELQRYFKRLRKGGHNFKYFGCGEYGDMFGRPHYHIILFGIGLSAWEQSELNIHWQKGHIDIGTAEPDSIKYVAGYIDKKDLRTTDDVTDNTFMVVSKGMGLKFAQMYEKQIKNMLYLSNRGVKTSLPRYYVNKLDIDREVLKKRAEETESEKMLELTGIDFPSFIEAYKYLSVKEVKRIDTKIKSRLALKAQETYHQVALKKRNF